MDEPKYITPILEGLDLSLEEKLNALPIKSGVYQFKNVDGKVIYVGKAHNLRNRVRQYFHKSRITDPRLDAMISKIADVDLTVTDNEIEALILEANLIKQIKPRYNVLLKDDKSYPYIAITKEQYPRVFVTRRKSLKASYYGPYTDVKAMRSALKTIRDIFFIRSCKYDLTEQSIKQGKFKVCLDYHIKKCEGPCEGYVSRERYNSMLSQAALVLRGKIKIVTENMKKEMDLLSDAMQFEEAALIRERINALKVYSEKQKVVDSDESDRDIIAVVSKEGDACAVIFKIRDGKIIGSHHIYLSNIGSNSYGEMLEAVMERYYIDQEDIPTEIYLSEEPDNIVILKEWLHDKSGNNINIEVPKSGDKYKLINLVCNNAQYWLDELELLKLKRDETVPHSLKSLQRDLRMDVVPKRIECFDISNIQGSDTVASLVVFVDGKPKKSEYRKFRIKAVSGPDDFASMQEVVERRYSRILKEKSKYPDLIIVDGGKGQLSSAKEVMNKLELNSIPIYGLAKRLEEIFAHNQKEPIVLPRTSSSLRLLQQIRDEAHRFAVSYHRSLRSKRIIKTELDEISGIGKKKAVKLLDVFGSLEVVKNVDEKHLTEIVGGAVAKRIIEYFNPKNENVEEN
jgi:excinuclease ABC subunit C